MSIQWAQMAGPWTQWVPQTSRANSAHRWSAGPDYLYRITLAGGAAIENVGYVFGGYGVSLGGAGQFVNDVQVWQSGAWRAFTASSPPKGKQNPCFAAWNDRLVLWGGGNGDTIGANLLFDQQNIWLLSPAPRTWSVLPLTPGPDAQAPSISSPVTCTLVGSVLYIWASGNPLLTSVSYGLLHKLVLQALQWISGPNLEPATTNSSVSNPPSAPTSPSSDSSGSPPIAVVAKA
ncbi:hypothetical protein BDK51DRAFT_29208 [Blyttiomyces helicus]|uniref:Galactose oxidase n=1 Tax=Blyttiomyces helicus TaxID=388810 RepID=A0A4P9W966_9FUNG|nr:hypothetical protein BDK51DRAFT_29208 [Blyttiomyces helicus]|eukprot:RKO89091.1 hypothetical protein BDK51DRAFT_29208 [Blyttiomyces helicus]